MILPKLPPIHSWLWSGHSFDPCETVPISDRGFRYGISVFESLPVRNGTPLFLNEHYERLQAACIETDLHVKLPASAEFITLLRGVPFDAFARIYVTAGDGGVSAGTEHGRVFVFVEPLTLHASSADGAYKLARHPSPFAPLFSGLKTANYWANIAAVQQARKNFCDEALLFDRNSGLISACMANVFIVRDGKIETPPAGNGARRGVIREWVMRRCAVGERRITADDLEHADEIFLTNSRIGIMPAALFDSRPLPTRIIASQLRVEYEKEISEVAGGG